MTRPRAASGGKGASYKVRVEPVARRTSASSLCASTQVRYLVNPRVRGYALTAADREFGQLTLASLYVAKPGF